MALILGELCPEVYEENSKARIPALVLRGQETGGFPQAGEFRLEVDQEKAYHAHTD